MSAFSVRLPDYLHEAIKELAGQEGISMNQFIAIALAEKVSALQTEAYLQRRAARGDREKFEAAMAKVANIKPEPADQLFGDKGKIWVSHTKDDKWKVMQASLGQKTQVFSTQEEAIKFGRFLASQHQADLVIQSSDGSIRHVYKYVSHPSNQTQDEIGSK